MDDFNPTVAPEVVAACQAGAAEIAAAMGRTFDAPVEVTVGEPGTLDAAAPPVGFEGAGLLVVLTVGSSGALVVLPESGGLLPPWYREPDPSGASKLTTLAQELGMLVLPEAFMPEDFKAAHVPSLAAALARGGVATGAALVPLVLKSGETGATASVIWPAATPANALAHAEQSPQVEESSAESAEPAIAVGSAPPPATKSSAATPEKSAVAASATAAVGSPPTETKRPRTPPKVEHLPIYTRSLLHIAVPVTVTLAAKKQPVAKIMELAPGSIIQFEKSCEEMLELEVGGQSVAQGEAVKVGDKFGIRLTSLIMPLERFKPVRPR